MPNSILNRLRRENPIVVTGLGSYSAAGPSVAALWSRAVAGLPTGEAAANFGFARCRAPQPDLTSALMRPVRKMDRLVQMAWIAANEALEQAQLSDRYPAERIGVAAGSSRGPLEKTAEAFAKLGRPNFLPSLGADNTFAVASGALAQHLKLKGPGTTFSATCASAAYAIAFGAEQILLGNADAMITGGAEAPLHPLMFAQLHAAGVLGADPDPALTCKPFDVARSGMILGEGSAFLVLESEQSAIRRGARILAHLAGWATGFDNSGRTGVDEAGAGLLQVMRKALDVAGLSAGDLDYINAHGTGTVMNDQAEARAVRELLGDRVQEVPCTSTKPITGHCLGATPALEAVICIEALRHQIIPPTAACVKPDPCCPIEPLPLVARPAPLRTVMSNSLGFWGYHASLIFSRAT